MEKESMFKLIAIQGLIKGVLVCVFTNVLITITLLFSSAFLLEGKNSIIIIPIVLPITTIAAYTFLNSKINLRQGLIIFVIWFLIFVGIELLKIIGLGLDPVIEIYSILIKILITLVPIGVGVSNTDFFAELQGLDD